MLHLWVTKIATLIRGCVQLQQDDNIPLAVGCLSACQPAKGPSGVVDDMSAQRHLSIAEPHLCP